MKTTLEQFDKYAFPANRTRIEEGLVAVQYAAPGSAPFVLVIRGPGDVIDPADFNGINLWADLSIYSETPKSTVTEELGQSTYLDTIQDIAEANYYLRLSGASTKVYWALMRFARTLGSPEFNLSFSRLAAHTGVSTKSVYRAVNFLRDTGKIDHSGTRFSLALKGKKA